MKEKIIEILQQVSISKSEHFTQLDNCVDELTALMCYREVRLLFKIERPVSSSELNQCAITCITILKSDYTEDVIMKAIEQVKNEMS